jgi:molybdate transport system ATP-binding protein
LGSFALNVSFETRGALTAIFGASGSGKSSMVNVIAGLIRPSAARIVIDDDVLVDTALGISSPAHRRRIGYVFQDARLFPHLSVEANLKFGRWFTPGFRRYAEFDHIVGMLDIASLLGRKPGQLSGGEKQRVSIGRALLASPRLLLMDEPLSSLDAVRKAEIIPYIEKLRDDLRIPIVYVSHSVAEVARLASDVVVMADGRVLANGPAADIVRRLDLMPADERDEGGSILELEAASYDEAFDMSLLRSPAGNVYVQGRTAGIGNMIRVRIRARDVMIAAEEPRRISALNVLRGHVTSIEGAGGASMAVGIGCGGATITARVTRQSAAALKLEVGMPVFAVVKTVSLA